MAFKMKGNPMQRNFGIGSPMKKEPTYNPDGKKLPAAKMDKIKPIEPYEVATSIDNLIFGEKKLKTK